MILDILNELAATSSRNEKIVIMKREIDNELLKRVINMALDPYRNFWIKKIPDYQMTKKTDSLSLSLDQLEDLSTRRVTGQAAIDFLVGVLARSEEPEVIARVIGRDLRCGIATSPNDVWPGLIPSFDVMLCDKKIEKIKFPAISQMKNDGARIHLHYDGATVTAFTRSGKTVELFGVFDESAKLMMHAGETWDGELLMQKNGRILERKTGNGLITKLMKGKGTLELANDLVMVTWDIVDFTSTEPYNERFNKLNSRFCLAFDKMASTRFRLVESHIVKNIDEALSHFDEMIARGEEGTILKNIDHKWEPKRSSQLCKLKAEEDCTLEVIGMEEGTGKNKGRMGALLCQSHGGGVKVKVGTGFSDELREEFWTKPPVFIDVIYNQIVSDKKTGQRSLFLPRFKIDRPDKVEADQL